MTTLRSLGMITENQGYPCELLEHPTGAKYRAYSLEAHNEKVDRHLEQQRRDADEPRR